MAKYMFRTRYTQSGLKGLLAEGGTGRETALRQTIEAAGGSLEGFYYAFGDSDLLPDRRPSGRSNGDGTFPEHRRGGCPHGIGDRVDYPGDRGRSHRKVGPVPPARLLTDRERLCRAIQQMERRA